MYGYVFFPQVRGWQFSFLLHCAVTHSRCPVIVSKASVSTRRAPLYKSFLSYGVAGIIPFLAPCGGSLLDKNVFIISEVCNIPGCGHRLDSGEMGLIGP